MGLQIVKTLANQIGGSLERIDTTETEFRVYFTTALRK
jgi:two-component sensor histidine kinase